MEWVKRFPKMVSKNDLRGKHLHITDQPPTPASKKGLYELIVQDCTPDVGFILYKLLLTSRDVDKIARLYTEDGKDFTFDEEEPWANVVAWMGETSAT